jgi:predicted ATPase with chaperone activity
MADPNGMHGPGPNSKPRDENGRGDLPDLGTAPLAPGAPPPWVQVTPGPPPGGSGSARTPAASMPLVQATGGHRVTAGPYVPQPGGPRASLQPAAGPNSGPNNYGLPPRPTTLAETDLDVTFLEELALKTVASVATITGNDLAERLRLPLAGVVEHVIGSLRRDNLIEPLGGGAAMIGAAGMNLRATERGVQRTHQISERSGYIGPAPVPIAAYDFILRQQAASRTSITREVVWRRLAHLVLPDDTVDRIGAGVESGGPIFLYGSPGNGKTAIGAAIARSLGGGVLVPHAVEVDGQIIRVFDPSFHHPVPPEKIPTSRLDDRWVPCYAPFVQVGGELRLQQLDLHWNERQRFYDSPIQVKAAGGVLLIDDFGRQQHRPEHLLNRWIVPLETGTDYLSLVTGRQVPLPFTSLLVFATNLDPSELADEAFLRRLPCKVLVPDPSPEAFREIFLRQCTELGVDYTESGFSYLVDRYYTRTGRARRASHPRDLLRLVLSTAHYFGVMPQLTSQLVDAAAGLYFI